MVVTLQNRRDQVQAHTFMVGRLQSALLKAEPDLATPPMRRTGSGLVIGGVLGTLAIAGFAVYAWISPGGATDWQNSGVLTVDRSTGTSYVWAGQKLYPVLNQASAKLLLGQDMTVESVTSSSLEGVRRGAAVGIAGAPETLPAARLSTDAWEVCATTTATVDGDVRAATSLQIGFAAGSTELRSDQAVLVRTTGGTRYLVTGGQRLKLTKDWVPRALGLDDAQTVTVTTSWIDALPAGPDLPQPTGVGPGGKGPTLNGTRTTTGQIVVVRTTGSADRYYLVTKTGLRTVSETAAALVLGDPATAKAYGKSPVEAVVLSPAALGTATVTEAPAWQSNLSPSPMTLAGTGDSAMPCVRVTPKISMVDVRVVSAPRVTAVGSTVLHSGSPSETGPEEEKSPRASSNNNDSNTSPADQIDIAAGAGLLARTLPAPGVPGAGLYLITEDGAKYPVASTEALEALGYEESQATAVPANLLELLPTGPVLSLLGSGGDAS